MEYAPWLGSKWGGGRAGRTTLDKSCGKDLSEEVILDLRLEENKMQAT